MLLGQRVDEDGHAVIRSIVDGGRVAGNDVQMPVVVQISYQNLTRLRRCYAYVEVVTNEQIGGDAGIDENRDVPVRCRAITLIRDRQVVSRRLLSQQPPAISASKNGPMSKPSNAPSPFTSPAQKLHLTAKP